MESGARLIEGEALEALKVMWAGSFCLFVADPPYLLDRMPRVRRRHLRAMDGGGLDWGRLFRELYRVMRQDSVLLLFGHLSSFLRLAESVGLGYVTDIVWVKPVPVNFLQARKKPLSRHELIKVWKKGRPR